MGYRRIRLSVTENEFTLILYALKRWRDETKDTAADYTIKILQDQITEKQQKALRIGY